MQNRRYLRDTINEFPRLYIHENLCPYNKSIFDKCLRIKTAGFIKRLWTYNGVVNFMISENPKEPPKKIHHVSELKNDFIKYGNILEIGNVS